MLCETNDDEETKYLPDKDVNGVEPNLYLGNLTAALDKKTLSQLHISHILTVDSKPLNETITSIKGMQFFYIQVDDMAHEDLLLHFEETFEFIRDAQMKGNCLVHCYFGMSRSATIVIAYLMKKYSLSQKEAFSRLKKRRKCVCPNDGFISQLNLYEKMNNKIDLENNNFKLYLLEYTAECFKSGRLSDDAFFKIVPIEYFTNSSPSNSIKCKSCRSLIMFKQLLIQHKPGVTPKWDGENDNVDFCRQGLFTIPCNWIKEIFVKPSGKILCRKCLQKLGSFNWLKGLQCPCQAIMKPAFYFIPSKVDISF